MASRSSLAPTQRFQPIPLGDDVERPAERTLCKRLVHISLSLSLAVTTGTATTLEYKRPLDRSHGAPVKLHEVTAQVEMNREKEILQSLERV